MASASSRATVRALLDLYGQTYAQELGIRLDRGGPSDLFRLLVAALLFSARISTNIAVAAAKALFDEGWTTAQKMADTTWRQRVTVLNRSGYARYDESTSRMLGDTCQVVLDQWHGDLRRLRDEAQRDPATQRELLKQCKGVGDVGVDIFFREAQAIWDELYPYADKRAVSAAKALDLGDDAEALAQHVARKDFPTLVASLVRAGQSDGIERVRRAAAGEDVSPQRSSDDADPRGRTKAELYGRAQDLSVQGRSSMSKDELVEAISRQG